MRLLLAAVVAVMASPTAAHFAPHRTCTHVSRGFRACTTFFERKTEQSAIFRRDGAAWTKVTDGLSHHPGWWRRVVASPDRKTLLAQWSGECESQSTYFVSSTGGHARPIFRGHSSTIAGWTHPGLARVRLEEAIWRKNVQVYRPGVYLVDAITLAVRLQSERPARTGC